MKVVSNIYWILAALLAAVFFRSFIVSVYKIPSASMAPTFLAGDYVLASQTAYKIQWPWSQEISRQANPAVNDLVVLQFSAKKAAAKSMAQYLKRIVAVAGDQIEIRQGRIILNGKECTYEKSESKPVAADVQIFTETCPNGLQHEVIFDADPNSKKTLESYANLTVPENEIYVLSDNRAAADDSRNFGPVTVDQIASKAALIWFSVGSTQDFISGPNQVRWNRILTKPR